jgi:hypothetical protein
MLTATATPESIPTDRPARPIICQFCKHPDVRPSRQSKPADAEHASRGEHAFRCRRCGGRFYALSAAPDLAPRRPRSFRSRARSFVKHRRARLLQVALFLVIFLLFLLFLRFLAHYQPDGAPSSQLIWPHMPSRC